MAGLGAGVRNLCRLRIGMNLKLIRDLFEFLMDSFIFLFKTEKTFD